MKAETEKNAAPSGAEIFVKMIVDAWEAQNAKADKLLAEISDERLQARTAPGANSGLYLFGHLTAVSDGLLPLLGFGEKLYPQLENVFLANPDGAEIDRPAAAELRRYWREINDRLREHIGRTTAAEWLGAHTAVASEDFAREPHRNKLNVLVSRTVHQSYHLGQLGLLLKK